MEAESGALAERTGFVDALQHVLLFADWRARGSAPCVCKTWHNALLQNQNDSHWEFLCERLRDDHRLYLPAGICPSTDGWRAHFDKLWAQRNLWKVDEKAVGAADTVEAWQPTQQLSEQTFSVSVAVRFRPAVATAGGKDAATAEGDAVVMPLHQRVAMVRAKHGCSQAKAMRIVMKQEAAAKKKEGGGGTEMEMEACTVAVGKAISQSELDRLEANRAQAAEAHLAAEDHEDMEYKRRLKPHIFGARAKSREPNFANGYTTSGVAATPADPFEAAIFDQAAVVQADPQGEAAGEAAGDAAGVPAPRALRKLLRCGSRRVSETDRSSWLSGGPTTPPFTCIAAAIERADMLPPAWRRISQMQSERSSLACLSTRWAVFGKLMGALPASMCSMSKPCSTRTVAWTLTPPPFESSRLHTVLAPVTRAAAGSSNLPNGTCFLTGRPCISSTLPTASHALPLTMTLQCAAPVGGISTVQCTTCGPPTNTCPAATSWVWSHDRHANPMFPAFTGRITSPSHRGMPNPTVNVTFLTSAVAPATTAVYTTAQPGGAGQKPDLVFRTRGPHGIGDRQRDRHSRFFDGDSEDGDSEDGDSAGRVKNLEVDDSEDSDEDSHAAGATVQDGYTEHPNHKRHSNRHFWHDREHARTYREANNEDSHAATVSNTKHTRNPIVHDKQPESSSKISDDKQATHARNEQIVIYIANVFDKLARVKQVHEFHNKTTGSLLELVAWFAKSTYLSEEAKNMITDMTAEMDDAEKAELWSEKATHVQVVDTTLLLLTYCFEWIAETCNIRAPARLQHMIDASHDTQISFSDMEEHHYSDDWEEHYYSDDSEVWAEPHYDDDWEKHHEEHHDWDSDDWEDFLNSRRIITDLQKKCMDLVLSTYKFSSFMNWSMWGADFQMDNAVQNDTLHHLFTELNSKILKQIEVMKPVLRRYTMTHMDTIIERGIRLISRCYESNQYGARFVVNSSTFGSLIKMVNNMMTQTINFGGAVKDIKYTLDLQYIMSKLPPSDNPDDKLIHDVDQINLQVIREEEKDEQKYGGVAWPRYTVAEYVMTRHHSSLKTFALPNTNGLKRVISKKRVNQYINHFTGKKWGKLLLNVGMLISALLQHPFEIIIAHDATRAILKPYVILNCNDERGFTSTHGTLFFGSDDLAKRQRNFEIMAQIAWRQIVWTIVEDSDASPVVQRYQSLFV